MLILSVVFVTFAASIMMITHTHSPGTAKERRDGGKIDSLLVILVSYVYLERMHMAAESESDSPRRHDSYRHPTSFGVAEDNLFVVVPVHTEQGSN